MAPSSHNHASGPGGSGPSRSVASGTGARRRYDTLGADADPAFDRLARLARRLLDAPVALITFVGAEGPWIKAEAGLDDTFGLTRAAAARRLPLGTHVIAAERPVVVQDTTRDDRFRTFPAVQSSGSTEHPAARFYAGVPITTPEGRSVGALCVFDTEPRSLPDEVVAQLGHVADTVVEMLEERQERSPPPLELNPTVLDALLGIFYVVGPDGRLRHWNTRLESISGYGPEALEGRLAYEFVREQDRPRVARAVMSGFATGSVALETHLVTNDGTEVPVLFNGVRTRIDGVPHLVGTGVDLSEQKATEAALRWERDLLEGIFNTSAAAITVLDTDGRIVRANARAEEVLGLSPSDVKGRSFDDPRWEHETLGGEPLPDAEQPFRRVMETEAPVYNVQHAITGPDGRRRVLSVNGAPLHDEETLVGAVFVVNDITGRREMENTLREREALLRSITGNITEGIYRSTPDEGIVYANDAFVRMFGYDHLDDVRGLASDRLYADPGERERLLREAGEEGTLDGREVEFRRRDGTTFVGLLSTRAVYDDAGNVRYYDGAITDITDRKAFEEKLTYRRRLEGEIVGISTTLIDTPVEDIDATIEEALGTVGRFMGADRSYVFRVDRDARTTSNTHEWCAEGIDPHQPRLQEVPYDALPWFMERMHDGDPLNTMVGDLPDAASGLRSVLKDGNIQSLVVLPMTREGTLVGFVGFDAVEERHSWEHDTVMVLRVLSDAVASALHRKAVEQEMIEARREAEEANRLKSNFLANMSHEIRTPLTSIIGFAEAIGDEVRALPEDEDGEERHTLGHFAELIERSGHRLLETLEAVLNLSKLQADEVDLDLCPVNLAQEAEGMVELLATQAESAGVELRAEGGGPDVDAPWARADENGLRIILRNLVSNAIKYTPEGGTVWVRSRRADDTAVLEVEDTGIGIDPDRVPDIFEAFRQESETANRSFEGIGLGLAVTRRLVHRMGGDIDVATEKGEGTCFTVRLPAASGPSAA